MESIRRIINGVIIPVLCAFACMTASGSHAALTPSDPFQAEALPDPNPSVLSYQSSIAYYDNHLIYAGSDGKIYGYDVDSGDSVVISDTSSLSSGFTAPQGFFVSSDNYLYFHDNAVSANVYRLQLSGTWPVIYESFDTGISSAIFAFTQNPWTDSIWFSSSDFFGSGNNFYLYEIDAAFTTATMRSTFAQQHANAGNGPMVFKGPSTILFGEAVFGGDGFFHLLNCSTGDLVQADYLTVSGGLGDATVGYNNRIYATSGGGRTVYELRGSGSPLAVGTTDDEARGITFGDTGFYVSEMVPFTSGTGDDGNIRFNRGSDPNTVTEISPVEPFRARSVDDPDPEVFNYQSSIAYYHNYLIYAGSDGKIHGFDLASSDSVVISDTSSLRSEFTAPQGFLVSSDNYLYFHDNALSANVYRVRLSDTWPAPYEALDTEVNSAIFALTENPWTKTIWFSSSDFFGSGNNFYLHELDAAFTTATMRSTFAQPHNNAGNGPIIFENETTLLYGEAVFGENGYFHQIDTDTGDVSQVDYLILANGLGDATYGYSNRIFVTSGGGKSILEINGNQQIELATTVDEARGIAFDGAALFISAMVPFAGSAGDGEISLLELWQIRATGVPADQRVDDSVDLNADGIPDNRQPDVILAVNSAGGTASKQIGISPVGTDVVIDALEAVAASSIDETANRPTEFPFDLINYRLKVNNADGIARVTVYLSEPVPTDAKWYKYDIIDGWVDYSAHATIGTDGRSVTIEAKDGGYGDLDRIVNGEIIDPGGVGVTTSPPVPPSGGGGDDGGGGCFIESTAPGVLDQGVGLAYLLVPLIAGIGMGIMMRVRKG